MTYHDPKTGRWAPWPLIRVFVYGTLKTGYSNNHVLGPRAELLGPAETCGSYRMYSVGFPVILEDGDGHRVAGELYQVPLSVVPDLDRLEGEGRMYDRKTIEVTLDIAVPYARILADNLKESNLTGLAGDDLMRSLERGCPISCYTYVGRQEYWEQIFKDRVSDPLNENGLHEWTELTYPRGMLDEDEVVEPEDQDQGDVLSLDDEREGP